ncbi:MAG: DNA-directed RNA polymerase subunit omega [bacterium]|nr:DNA-directed RNA polymerase subunit omega [bacterium]
MINNNEIFSGENRHLLVLVASKRARQIAKGSSVLVETKYRKPTSIALEELKNKKIEFKIEK